MTEFDLAVKRRAVWEGCPVPADFDGRVEAILAALPKKKRTRGRIRQLRTVLLAAVLCILCAVSALALSPSLREQLAAVLGEFAPYAQTVEESICVKNGVEIRAISAMADGSMVKVYAEARDLEGDRLTSEMLEAEQAGQSTVWGVICRDNTDSESEEAITGAINRARCVGFDETAETALLEFCTWGTFPSDVQEMELIVFNLYPQGWSTDEEIGGEFWRIPLTIETVESRSFQLSGTVEGAELSRLELSTLGLALITKGDACPPTDLTVFLEDGSRILAAPDQGLGGGALGSRVTYWEFADPMEIENVAAVAFGLWYIPLNADGTAGEGRWISE